MKYVTALLLALIIMVFEGCKPSMIQNSRAVTAPQLSTGAADLFFFPQTGHSVGAPFLDYYVQHNEQTLLGYPITEAMEHEGWLVQYFQNGRLEVHPENPPAYFITIGWLGQLSNRTTPPHPANPETTGQFFAKTGHSIYNDFLAFFKENGGTVQFGQPISSPFLQNGVLNQDFQSARFTWKPYLPPGKRVQLEPLGEDYFLSSGLPLQYLAPIDPPTHATIVSPPTTPLPPKSDVLLKIETTPHPDIIRVFAIVTRHNAPVKGYAPRLNWGSNWRTLPPTQTTGETHLLVNTTGQETLSFILYDGMTNEPLAKATYSNDCTCPQKTNGSLR